MTPPQPADAASTVDDVDVDVDEAFRDLVLQASLGDTQKPNPVVDLLHEHLGADPVKLAQATHEFRYVYDGPVAQAGIDAFLAAPGRTHRYVGVSCPLSDPNAVIQLPMLFTPPSLTWPGVTLTAPVWERLEVGYDRTMRILFQGLILINDDRGPAVIWVNARGFGPAIIIPRLTVAAVEPDRATEILAEIIELSIEHSPYRGEMFHVGGRKPLNFVKRPAPMTKDDVILPSGLLERIDQHAIGISRAARRLSGVGQHLKRGLLLYGPPGTGKTHTIRYLASQLPPETSVAILPPGGTPSDRLLELMGPSAMVVLDDVDYTAADRSLPGIRIGLFQLLETLDGLHGHGDVLFVLTTNRLEALEPAVSARPGRIDEALEVPRPDADCRRRLFALYRRDVDLTMSAAEVEQVVERTDGVTAAFTKELLRRSVVIAVKNGAKAQADPATGRVPVTAADVFEALDQMLDPDNPVTQLLLGAEPKHTRKKIKFISTE